MEVCVNRFLTICVEQKKQKIFSCVQLPEITRSLLDQLQQVTALQLVTLRDLVNLKKRFGEVILSMGWNELSDVWSMGSGGLPGGKWVDGMMAWPSQKVSTLSFQDFWLTFVRSGSRNQSEGGKLWVILLNALHAGNCCFCLQAPYSPVIQSRLQKFDILRTPFK